MDFSNAIVNGFPLSLIVLGLVEWIKRLGVTGKRLRAVSLGVGLIIGLAYQISLAIPADFTGWFGAVIYGLALGLVASGTYDALRHATGG